MLLAWLALLCPRLLASACSICVCSLCFDSDVLCVALRCCFGVLACHVICLAKPCVGVLACLVICLATLACLCSLLMFALLAVLCLSVATHCFDVLRFAVIVLLCACRVVS